jgi:hypothetical protein
MSIVGFSLQQHREHCSFDSHIPRDSQLCRSGQAVDSNGNESWRRQKPNLHQVWQFAKPVSTRPLHWTCASGGHGDGHRRLKFRRLLVVHWLTNNDCCSRWASLLMLHMLRSRPWPIWELLAGMLGTSTESCLHIWVNRSVLPLLAAQ